MPACFAHAPLRLWSVQSKGAYQSFLRAGFFCASRDHVDPDFVRAYNWMSGQLEKKTARPEGVVAEHPVWAWFQYDGVGCRQPNVQGEGLLPSGTEGVLLELWVPPNLLLLSDFQKWHAVLNEEYLPKDTADQRDFDAWVSSLDSCASKTSRVRARVEASWDQIFDLGAGASDCWEAPEQRQIQAVLWQIDASMLNCVTHFVAA